MKKVLIVAALIFANQAFAKTPAKTIVKETSKSAVVSKFTTTKAKSNKVDWFMGTNAVIVATGDTGGGCNGGGSGWGGWGGWGGWFRGWWK